MHAVTAGKSCSRLSPVFLSWTFCLDKLLVQVVKRRKDYTAGGGGAGSLDGGGAEGSPELFAGDGPYLEDPEDPRAGAFGMWPHPRGSSRISS